MILKNNLEKINIRKKSKNKKKIYGGKKNKIKIYRKNVEKYIWMKIIYVEITRGDKREVKIKSGERKCDIMKI